MKSIQTRDYVFSLIVLLLAFIAWVITDHPEWLIWFFTYKG